VTCNALAPGFVVTPLTEQAVNTIPGFAERHAAASMVGRNGLPEDFRRSHLSRVRRQCLCDGAHTVCRWWLRRQSERDVASRLSDPARRCLVSSVQLCAQTHNISGLRTTFNAKSTSSYFQLHAHIKWTSCEKAEASIDSRFTASDTAKLWQLH
jgi:hypothetical protein